MKLFERDGKVNFVDENNVFLGYDLNQNCCERADWFIADKPQDTIVEPVQNFQNLDGYIFDTSFFKLLDADFQDGGGMAIFRIVHVNGSEKFIHIFNSHNGYYCHGFELTKNGDILHDGEL